MRGLTLLLGVTLLGIVDRIEGSWAVVEWRTADGLVLHDVPAAWLPSGVGEGDGLHAELRDDCDGPDGLQRFLYDAAACGGRVQLRPAPPWTGIVHNVKRRQP